jgi:LPS-assembly protein
LLSHNWAQFGFQGLIEFTQNLEYSSNNRSTNKGKDDNPTLQRLPELNLNLYQTEITNTPFTMEGSSQFASFWREYGTAGSRFDIQPVLGLPLHFKYGSVIPKIGTRMTTYFINRFEGDNDQVDTQHSMQTRFFPDFQTVAYSEFSRIFTIAEDSSISKDAERSSLLKLKHAFQPMLEYTFITDVNQEKFPYFDEIDRIEPQHDLSYSITNVFTTKNGSWKPSSTNPDSQSVQYTFHDLARLRFEQSYDFREATRTHNISEYSRRPFSDILTDLTTSLTPWLYLSNKSWFSPYEGYITEHEHSLFFIYDNIAYASYSLDFLEKIDEYKREEQERQRIASYGAGVSFDAQWHLDFLYRVDYEASTDLEKALTLRYDHQCFSAETSLSQTDEDTRFEFRISFAQLGSIGR